MIGFACNWISVYSSTAYYYCPVLFHFLGAWERQSSDDNNFFVDIWIIHGIILSQPHFHCFVMPISAKVVNPTPSWWFDCCCRGHWASGIFGLNSCGVWKMWYHILLLVVSTLQVIFCSCLLPDAYLWPKNSYSRALCKNRCSWCQHCEACCKSLHLWSGIVLPTYSISLCRIFSIFKTSMLCQHLCDSSFYCCLLWAFIFFSWTLSVVKKMFP